MTVPDWSKRCACSERGFLRANDGACRTCGAGARDTWTLRRLDAMAQYQRLFRLKPIGPHRELVERVLRPLVTACNSCRGAGMKTWKYGYPWHCDQCEALGAVWAVPSEQVEAARALILAEYPDAAAPAVAGPFGRQRFAFDDATNCVCARPDHEVEAELNDADDADDDEEEEQDDDADVEDDNGLDLDLADESDAVPVGSIRTEYDDLFTPPSAAVRELISRHAGPIERSLFEPLLSLNAVDDSTFAAAVDALHSALGRDGDVSAFFHGWWVHEPEAAFGDNAQTFWAAIDPISVSDTCEVVLVRLRAGDEGSQFVGIFETEAAAIARLHQLGTLEDRFYHVEGIAAGQRTSLGPRPEAMVALECDSDLQARVDAVIDWLSDEGNLSDALADLTAFLDENRDLLADCVCDDASAWRTPTLEQIVEGAKQRFRGEDTPAAILSQIFSYAAQAFAGKEWYAGERTSHVLRLVHTDGRDAFLKFDYIHQEEPLEWGSAYASWDALVASSYVAGELLGMEDVMTIPRPVLFRTWWYAP